MSRSESKSANYAQIAQRDKLAAALAAETGCSFVEAWTRVLDGELPRVEQETSASASRVIFPRNEARLISR